MQNVKLTKSGVVFVDRNGNRLTVKTSVKKSLVRVRSWFADFGLFVLHLISLHVPFYGLRKCALTVAGVTIGRYSTVHMGAKFFSPRGVTIGQDSIIGDRAFLDGRAQLTIGDHVNIASEVMIYNSEHDISSPTFEPTSSTVTIGDYVFIGPRAIILPGVTIGKGAVIAAGAVVTRNVDDFSVVAGVPAKPIGQRPLNEPSYRLGRARLFQ